MEWLEVLLIGVIGSGGVLFGSYMGLKNYEELPKKLFTTRNLIAYGFFGGAFALILQLSSEQFAPLYSLAVGAGWPSLLIGLSTSQTVQQIVDERMKKHDDLLKDISGEQ